MTFYIITWKEFKDGKMIDKAEIVKDLQVDVASSKMKEFNAQKRLTTTDYRSFDLSQMLEIKGLDLSEKVESIPKVDESDIDPEILNKIREKGKRK
jgi:uncharacterized protein YnzC (UPF0291/DUF896 family)